MADVQSNNANESSKDKPAFSSITILRGVRTLWRFGLRFHLFWEISLAVALAVYFGYYWAGYDRPVYKIYVLVGDDIPNTEGKDLRENLSRAAQSLTVNGTVVTVEFINIPAHSQGAAVVEAQNIREANDALLVVGVLDSAPTEDSLPYYLHARPQIPFIATVQSNSNLMSKCDGACSSQDMPVPLLQLSPTNADEAKWAVKFAKDQGRKRFLVVSDDNSPNQSYVKELTTAFDKEIPSTDIHVGAPLGSVKGILASDAPECILFAGDSGNAQVLMQAVASAAQNKPGWAPSVILSDTAVPPTINSVNYNSPVNLTDQSDASYYTSSDQPNAYALDGLTIAVTLLKELNERGFDLQFRLKSALLNRASAQDVRRNLIRIMQEDFRYHSSFRGAEETGPIKGLSTIYSFDCPMMREDGTVIPKSDGTAAYCQRYGGIFHVWRWNPTTKEMADVDYWHPKRTTPRR